MLETKKKKKKNSDAILCLYRKSLWENCPIISHNIFLFHRKLINSKKKKKPTQASLVCQPAWASSNILTAPHANPVRFIW